MWPEVMRPDYLEVVFPRELFDVWSMPFRIFRPEGPNLGPPVREALFAVLEAEESREGP